VRLSIILPTLNEYGNIEILINEICESLPNEIEFEILVVDDQSTDGTAELVDKICATNSRVLLISRPNPNGLTGAINAGVLQAKYENILWMDADRSMPAFVIPNLIAAKNLGFDIAMGSRFVSGGGYKGTNLESSDFSKVKKVLKNSEDAFLAVILSRFLNIFLSRLLGFGIKDYTSGFILATKNIVVEIGLTGNYGEYCPRFLFRAAKSGFSISEVGYINLPRVHGVSKTGTSLSQYIWRGLPYVYVAVTERLKSLW
jgi:dolichol-phosphate mannosyltransferase